MALDLQQDPLAISRPHPLPPSRGEQLATWALLLGSCFLCFRVLYYQASEEAWVPIARMMDFTADPPFRHRVLVVWLANALRSLFPGLSETRCFFLSQVPVFLATFVAIRVWAGRWVSRPVADLAPAVLALMLIPTFSYWNFYDVAIVLTFTASLLALAAGSWLSHLVVLGIGTLNHEITLFLIPVSMMVAWRDPRLRPRLWWWGAAQLATYAAVRLALFIALPVATAYSVLRMEDNLLLPFRQPLAMVNLMAALLPWYALAGLGLGAAPPLLRKATVLLPFLFAEIYVLGQFNEVRHFNPLIPVVLPLALLGVERRVRWPAALASSSPGRRAGGS